MPYEVTYRSRTWGTYVTFVVSTAVIVFISTFFPVCLVVFAPVFAWVLWCVLIDRKWRLRVGDGVVAWNPFFSHAERVIRLLNIEDIVVVRDHEGPTLVTLRLKDGKRTRLTVPRDDEAQFLAAVQAGNPAVTIAGNIDEQYRFISDFLDSD